MKGRNTLHSYLDSRFVENIVNSQTLSNVFNAWNVQSRGEHERLDILYIVLYNFPFDNREMRCTEVKRRVMFDRAC